MNAPENASSLKANQDGWMETESLDGIYVQVDAEGDTTIRPTPPNIPLRWPPAHPRRPQGPAQPIHEKPNSE